MKAGIYRNPTTGQLLYVAGDRRITAYTRNSDNSVQLNSPIEANEFKVRSRNNDAQVELEDGTLCDRIADTPKPYVNNVALEKYIEANPKKLQRALKEVESRAFNDNGGDIYAETAKSLKDYVPNTAVRIATKHFALGAPYGAPHNTLGDDRAQQRMRALGYRPCHAQSARKHRKQGHIVLAAGKGAYWWLRCSPAGAIGDVGDDFSLDC